MAAASTPPLSSHHHPLPLGIIVKQLTSHVASLPHLGDIRHILFGKHGRFFWCTKKTWGKRNLFCTVRMHLWTWSMGDPLRSRFSRSQLTLPKKALWGAKLLRAGGRRSIGSLGHRGKKNVFSQRDVPGHPIHLEKRECPLPLQKKWLDLFRQEQIPAFWDWLTDSPLATKIEMKKEEDRRLLDRSIWKEREEKNIYNTHARYAPKYLRTLSLHYMEQNIFKSVSKKVPPDYFFFLVIVNAILFPEPGNTIDKRRWHSLWLKKKNNLEALFWIQI